MQTGTKDFLKNTLWLAIGWVVFSIIRMFPWLFLVLGIAGIAWFTVKEKNAEGQLAFGLMVLAALFAWGFNAFTGTSSGGGYDHEAATYYAEDSLWDPAGYQKISYGELEADIWDLSYGEARVELHGKIIEVRADYAGPTYILGMGFLSRNKVALTPVLLPDFDEGPYQEGDKVKLLGQPVGLEEVSLNNGDNAVMPSVMAYVIAER